MGTGVVKKLGHSKRAMQNVDYAHNDTVLDIDGEEGIKFMQ